jgi:hypothetical protein
MKARAEEGGLLEQRSVFLIVSSLPDFVIESTKIFD